ncbi:MAG: nidogen-like domain-containing protein [Myxococcota bacterium]
MTAKTLSLTLVALLGVSATTRAQAPLLSGLGGPRDYGTECLFRNDDGSSLPIDLTPAFPSGLQFFDGTFTQVYVNTNGNLTFGGPLRTFTPDPFPIASQPMIAPYWADVDIRQPPGTTECTTGLSSVCPADAEDGNTVWWTLEPGRMVVTWDEVGYFSCRNDLRMNFQLLLTALPTCGDGATDFDVEFRFNRCEWETGEASGGTDGFGGTQAQSGFDAGNLTDFVALPGSRTPGIADALCTGSNLPRPEAGVWRFQIRRGEVLCPEAGDACDTGEAGVCATGVIQCDDPAAGGGTFCQPVAAAGSEVCNALDDDCDGAVDEGEDICGSGPSVCDRGACIDVCFEGGCPPGFGCNAEGRCIEDGCEGVECPGGQRCRAGECVDACVGIRCPLGQDCFAGRCLDLCEGIFCDPECTVCDAGECIDRCSGDEECARDEACVSGACVARSCLGVTCEDGFVCDPELGCIANCAGVRCPRGELCRDGMCIPEREASEPDMGPGDMGADMGPEPEPDMGVADLGAPDMAVERADLGTPRGRPSSGCTAATGATAWPLVLLLLARRRRRRIHQ